MRLFMASVIGGYLGFSLMEFAKLDFKSWEFWAIVLPMGILVTIYGMLERK